MKIINKLILIARVSVFSAVFASGFAILSCSKKNSENAEKAYSAEKSVQNIENYYCFDDENKIPQRIVSLSPAATEILCAGGAFNQIAARSDFCDYPPEVKNLPSAGGFDGKSISIETILSFKPDFVYLTKGMHDFLISTLAENKINFYISDANSIKSILNEIRNIGKITGHGETGIKTAEQIEAELEKIRKSTENLQKFRVYWEIWDSPYMSIGKNSFLNELVEIAGGKNIFYDIENAYPTVSEEVILARNPEIIISNQTFGAAPEQIALRTGWKTIEAVKKLKIFQLDTDLINRPGPRIGKMAEVIAKTLHPEIEF